MRRDGICLHSIHYWADTLSVWVARPQKMIVRYDPRDLSRAYLLAPDGQYYDLTYRDLRRPPITLWEQRLALKRLREEGRAHVDEAAIFRAVEAMRSIAQQAVRESKTVRRQRERRWQLTQGGRSDDTPNTDPTQAHSDSNTLQPWERMLPVEDWT